MGPGALVAISALVVFGGGAYLMLSKDDKSDGKFDQDKCELYLEKLPEIYKGTVEKLFSDIRTNVKTVNSTIVEQLATNLDKAGHKEAAWCLREFYRLKIIEANSTSIPLTTIGACPFCIYDR